MSTETDNTYDIDCNDDECSHESCQWHRAPEIAKLNKIREPLDMHREPNVIVRDMHIKYLKAKQYPLPLLKARYITEWLRKEAQEAYLEAQSDGGGDPWVALLASPLGDEMWEFIAGNLPKAEESFNSFDNVSAGVNAFDGED